MPDQCVPSARRWLPREGLYLDPICWLLARTVLNPLLTGPALLLSHHLRSSDQSLLSLESGFWNDSLNSLKICTIIGGVFWVNQILNWGANNHFTRAVPWNPQRELVLITGGSGGIGASIARRLAGEGTRVVVLDILPLSFPKGENMAYYKCDLSDMVQIKEVMATVREECGHPTAVVNNAGLSRGFTVAESTYYDNELTLRINLLAAFLVTKECLPDMVANNHGHIFNIASMSAFIPPAGLADYSASKAGLIAFHEVLGLELQYRHKAPAVRTSIIVLSFTKTPLFAGKTNQNEFFTPLLHVDTIGDTVVDTIYQGYSRTIFMPGILRYVAWIRGAPDWLQYVIRKGTENLQVDFRGRQIVDLKTGRLKS